MLKFKNKKEKIRFIVITSLILIFVLLGVLTPIIFKGSTFDTVISNSIGKFFNIIKFFSDNYVNILESIAIIVFMWIINQVLRFILKIFTARNNHSETIGKLLLSVVAYGSVIVTLFLILSAWGVQTPTLLASAGILGLAISFGAQSLIEDIFAGLFIIFEKQYVVGDVIQIGDFRGTVIEIGIRVTKIEDINGDIKTINNSDVRGAINTSSCLSPAICDISISYGADLQKIEMIIEANLQKMKTEIPTIAEGPYYKGVQSLANSSVVIRIYAKTLENNKYQAVRDMNRFMKVLFDNNGIELPFPQLVVHTPKEDKK